MSKSNQKQKRSGLLSETLPLNPDDVLVLHCDGPVSIKGASGSDVSVKGTGDLAWHRDGRQIHAHCNGAINVAVPRDARVQMHLDGPIKITGIDRGEIEILSANGPVNLKGGASLRIYEADGAVDISDVRGPVTIDMVDGPTTFNDIHGDITVVQADGPVTIQGCGGNVDATCDRDVFIALTGSQPQNIRLRVDGSVYLKMPETAYITGTIAANGDITVALDNQQMQAKNDVIELLPPTEGAGAILSLDIKANEDVYVGPNPPDPSMSMGFHTLGLGWLSAIFGRRRSASRTETPSPPAEQTESSSPNDTSTERKIILRMVAEGKITAEEGERLMEALE